MTEKKISEKESSAMTALFGVAKNVKLTSNHKSLKLTFTLQTTECNTPPFLESELSINVAACVVLASRLAIIDNLLSNISGFSQTFEPKTWPDSVDKAGLFKNADMTLLDQYFCEFAIPTVGIDYGKIGNDFYVKLSATVDKKQPLICLQRVDGTIQQAVQQCRDIFVNDAKQVHKLMVERTQIFFFFGVKVDTEKFMGELAATCARKQLNMVQFAGYLIVQSVGSIVKVDESGLKHEYVSTTTKETLLAEGSVQELTSAKKEETNVGFVGKEGVANSEASDIIQLEMLAKRYPLSAVDILEKIKKGK